MAVLIPVTQQYFDNNGDPLAGGKIYFYEAGTTTPKDTYTTQGAGTPNANPVILDASGRASIWGTGSYKISIYTSADVLIKTVDDVMLSAEELTLHETAKIPNTLVVQDYDVGFYDYNCTLEEISFIASDGTGTVSAYLSPDTTSASGTLISGASAVSVSTSYVDETLTANNTVTAASPKYLVIKCTASTGLKNLITNLTITKTVDA